MGFNSAFKGLIEIEQLDEALNYKPEGRGVVARWGSMAFSIDLFLTASL